MKEGPEFRVIGGVSEEKKEEVRENLSGSLYEKHLDSLPEDKREKIEKAEYLKTDAESQLFAEANVWTNALMKESGVEPYDVPLNNFHLLPRETFKEVIGGEGNAITYNKDQIILMDGDELRSSNKHIASVSLHELLHLKSHFAVEAGEYGAEQKLIVTPYREGVTVRARQEKGLYGNYYEHFGGLNEAIVSSLQKKYTIEVLADHRMLEEENAWMRTPEAQAFTQKIAERNKKPTEEIFWVSKDGKKYDCITYEYTRETFQFVLEEIAKEFPEEYSSVDDVLKEFTKSHFTGNLLSIGRLIEKTFGEGSFRTLGSMGPGGDDALAMLATLKEMRQKKLEQV